jgi:hypothetical protein
MAGQHWWVGGLTSVRFEDAKSDSSLNDNRINYRGDTVLDHEIVCRRFAQSELKLHERLPTTCIAVRCGAFSPDGFKCLWKAPRLKYSSALIPFTDHMV